MTDPTDVHGAVRASERHDAPPARAHSADDATRTVPPTSTDASAADAVDVENPPVASDAALSSSITDEQVAASPATDDDASVAASAGVPAIASMVCRVCDSSSDGDRDLRVCAGCGIAVHASCYGAPSTDAHSAHSSEHQEQEQQQEQKQEQELESENGATVARDEGEVTGSAAWTCDCCAHQVASVQDLQCVFCEQRADGGVMKHVETRAWRPQPTGSFAHLLCSRWDPHAFKYVVPTEADASAEQQQQQLLPTPQLLTRGTRKLDNEMRALGTADTAAALLDADSERATTVAAAMIPPAAPASAPPADASAFDSALSLPSACCFCASDRGIRIQCQCLDCGLFFHAMCAYKSNGLVAIRSPSPHSALIEYHAYCGRHSEHVENANSLLQKLLSKPIAALTGRDSALRLQTVRRRLDAHAFGSIDAFFDAVAMVLVDLYKKGLKASKAEPPVPNVKHLQALQFFVSHIAQLRVVYRASPHVRVALGDDSEQLYELLQKTFDPTKYLGKYAGPVSQVHTCQVCRGPFHERQHLFYCSHPTAPHAQHWKCTKRRSNSREREKIAAKVAAAASSSSSAKKKLKALALVVNGQWRDVKLPKGLPGVSDGIICAICRCDVDASGLIASRKEGKRAEFAKKTSRFALGGCYMNASELPKTICSGATAASSAATATSAGTGVGTARPPLAPKTESGKHTKAAASDRNRGKRSGGSETTAASSAKTNGAATATLDATAAAASPAVLAPPKMERINVQRTTKWLAYVAQIIRLAGTVAKLSSEAATAAAAASTATPADDLTTCVKDEPSDAAANIAPDGASTQAAAEAPVEVPAKAATSDAPMPEADTATQDPTAATAAVSVKVQAATTPSAASDVASTSTTSAVSGTVAAVTKAVAADTPVVASVVVASTRSDAPSEIARLAQTIDAYFTEAMQIVRPFDAYALSKLETARAYLLARNGPAVGVLRMLAHEYTRFLYIKHTRAVEKAANEKRKREEQDALEQKERARKRLEREAEAAHQSQLLAMRQKKRKLSKMA